MNCVKCYQEIPEGSRFCPYCGAEQTAASVSEQPADAVQATAETVNEQPADAVQTTAETVNEQPADTAQTASAAPYQDPYNAGDQGAYSYGNSSQNNSYQNNSYQNNNYQNNNYQNSSCQSNGYQNGNYQNTPSYQQGQGDTVNWVPYLVVSIISTLCCCIPFGIVAIVFSAKINSAVTSGNMEEAKKAAKTAKLWIIVAVVAGLIANIAFLVITAMSGAGSYYYYY